MNESEKATAPSGATAPQANKDGSPRIVITAFAGTKQPTAVLQMVRKRGVSISRKSGLLEYDPDVATELGWKEGEDIDLVKVAEIAQAKEVRLTYSEPAVRTYIDEDTGEVKESLGRFEFNYVD